MARPGIITGSARTTAGAVGEIIVFGAIGVGIGFLGLLIIAACGGLQLVAEVAR